MPSLERIAGFAVVEIVFGSGPADNPEVLAEVLGVAAGAVQVSLCAVEDFAVIAAVLCHQVPDFPVARLAVEFRRARPKAVAARAFDRTVDRLVRLGKRSGRYLPQQGEARETDHEEDAAECRCPDRRQCQATRPCNHGAKSRAG